MMDFQRVGIYLIAGAAPVLAACCNTHLVDFAPSFFGSVTVKVNAIAAIWSGGLLVVVGRFPKGSIQ